MNKAFAALMPAHHELLEVVAAHVQSERGIDPVFALQGQPRLVAIAQQDRELALALNRLIDELTEADFGEAARSCDELSHRIRTHFLRSLSDPSGTVRH